MHKGVFITGTGTDIGKTYVTALLVKKLYGTGADTAYFKAAVSGNERGADGRLIPGDAAFVKRISGIPQPLDTMCRYVYEKPLSPHLAARLEGGPVDLECVKAEFDKLCEKYEYVVCEGSGGIVCPIRCDEKNIMLEDIIKALDLPCIIVADAGLGTINSTVLTTEYMRAHSMKVSGIILNHYHEDSIMEKDNRLMCEQLTGLPVIAAVADDDTSLDIDTDVLRGICGQGGKL